VDSGATKAQGKTELEMAPQLFEKIESRCENGMVSEASDPQDLVHGARLTARLD
jgi:hypothetical protein